MSAFGRSSSWNSSRNDGIAMPTRIRTGIIVHATSIIVLWVVFDGTGLARALNRNIAITISAVTNSVITVMTTRSPLCIFSMLSITGDAEPAKSIPQGCGPTSSAETDPQPAAKAAAPNAIPRNRRPNRRPYRPFDIFMPLALLVINPHQHLAAFDTGPTSALRTGRFLKGVYFKMQASFMLL